MSGNGSERAANGDDLVVVPRSKLIAMQTSFKRVVQLSEQLFLGSKQDALQEDIDKFDETLDTIELEVSGWGPAAKACKY